MREIVFGFVALLSFAIWPFNSLCFALERLANDDREGARKYLALFIVGGICLVEFGLGWGVPALGPFVRLVLMEAALVHYFIGAISYLILTMKTIRERLG